MFIIVDSHIRAMTYQQNKLLPSSRTNRYRLACAELATLKARPRANQQLIADKQQELDVAYAS